jgi:DNA-binding NtrC family response regulator
VNTDFEKNKLDLLNTIKSIKHTEQSPQPAEIRVVVYGIASPFMTGFLEALKKQCEFESFDDFDNAISYCFDHDIQTVILDMDPPTDWKMATDIFTNVRTMKPKVHFILMTKTPESVPVLTLAAQSAEVLEKPFGIEKLMHAMKPKTQG